MADNEERPAKLRRMSNGEKIDATTKPEERSVGEHTHKTPAQVARSEPALGHKVADLAEETGTPSKADTLTATNPPVTAPASNGPKSAGADTTNNGAVADGSVPVNATHTNPNIAPETTSEQTPRLDTTTSGTIFIETTQTAAKDTLPATTTTAPETPAADSKPLSKNAQKKLRKKAEWEAGREDRKLIRKEKITAKRERKKEAKRTLAENPPGPSEPLTNPADSAVGSANKSRSHRPVQLPVTFLIDCNFDELMTDSERISLGSQVTRCYSDNRTAPFRAHLAIASFGGKLRERFEGLLKGVHKSWKGTKFLDEGFVEVAEMAKAWMTADGQEGGLLKGAFAGLDAEAKDALKAQGEVIYLSSEADEELTELKPYSTYIIGGLVDKNREKGICHRKARQAGIKTARLPIGKYLEMQSRKVLTTNHVNEIMVRWLECRDWGEAFMKVIPKRKGGRLRGEKVEDLEGEVNEGGDRNGDGDAEAEGGAVEAEEGEEVAAEIGLEAQVRADAPVDQHVKKTDEAEGGTSESDIDIAF